MTKPASAAFLPICLAAATLAIGSAAFAQCNMNGSPMGTLRDPLIYGATSSAPFQVAPEGQPPPVGDGPMPAPVNPGMSIVGGPTVIPSVPTTPANDIANPSYQINWDPNTVSMPGEVGISITAPPPASTPGTDPGQLPGPLDFTPPPASVVNINPGGGISGSAPTARWGGQQSHDYGLYRTRGTKTDDMGTEETGSESQDGQNRARSGATDTQDLYGSRFPLRPLVQDPNGTTTTTTNVSVTAPNGYEVQSWGDPSVQEQYQSGGPPTRPQGVQVTNGSVATTYSTPTSGNDPVQTIAPY